MSFLKRLSTRQRVWFAGTIITMTAMLAAGWMLEPAGDDAIPPSFTTDMTIRQIAPELARPASP